jgi:hypothetical protein
MIDGQYIYVLVDYFITTRYPTACLTWGLGATYGNPGLEVDSNICPPGNVTPSFNRITGVHVVKDETGTLGAFLSLDQPLHSGHQVQSSFNLSSWATVPRNDLLLSADGKKIYYQSPSHNYQFFRLVVGD